MGQDKAPLLGIVVLGLVICFSPSGCVGQEAPTIVVDSGTKIVESDSGDDLGTLQNIFQDANAPQDGTIDPMTQIIADLKMKRMRILGPMSIATWTRAEPRHETRLQESSYALSVERYSVVHNQ
jgi:hypothetical protein